MRVAIIDSSNGEIVAVGESDGKRYDEYYVKVVRDGATDKSAAATLTFAAAVYPEALAPAISDELKRLHAIRVEADRAFSKALYDFANRLKAFTGSESK